MSSAILYYSLSGKTKAYAEKLGAETNAAVFEIREIKPYNGFTSFIPGLFRAGGFKRSAIHPVEIDFATYDEISIMGPIWAGRPAPAVNSAIDLLPEGKAVSLICTSGKGGYDLSKTAEMISARGCAIVKTLCLKAEEL